MGLLAGKMVVLMAGVDGGVMQRSTKEANSLTVGIRQSLKPAPKVLGLSLTFLSQLAR